MRNNACEAFDRLLKKYRATAPLAAAEGLLPYRGEGGRWLASPFDGNSWWTGGFWPGIMWQLYAASKDAFFLEEARRAEALLTGIEPGSSVSLGVNGRELSQMIGQHRENLRWLRETYGLRELKIVPSPVKSGEICRLAVEKPADMV